MTPWATGNLNLTFCKTAESGEQQGCSLARKVFCYKKTIRTGNSLLGCSLARQVFCPKAQKVAVPQQDKFSAIKKRLKQGCRSFYADHF
jgi:hypothetical protein